MDSKAQAVLEKLYQTTQYDILLREFKWEYLTPSEWNKIREEIKKMTDSATVDNAYQFLYKTSSDSNFKLDILKDVNLHKKSSLQVQKDALKAMEQKLSEMWVKIKESNSITQYILNYFKHVAWLHVIKGETAEREKDAINTINNFIISKYFFELFGDRNAPIINNRLEIKFKEIGNSTSENNESKKEIISLEIKYAKQIKEINSANAELKEKLENLKSEKLDLKKTVVDIQAIEKEHLEQLTEILGENDDLREEIETLKNQFVELKSQKEVISEKPRQKKNLPGFVLKNLGDSNG